MKRNLLFLIIAIMFSFAGNSQSLWRTADENRVAGLEKTDRSSMPDDYKLFSLDINALKAVLKLAPSRGTGVESEVILPFPDGNGKMGRFRIYEASVMHPDLAAQFPDMGSYVGVGIDDHTATIRFSVTMWGLHTMTLSSNGTSYTDPYTKDLTNYISYKKSALKAPRNFSCGVSSSDEEAHRSTMGQNVTQGVMANDGLLRRYRLAMACSVEYAAYHIAAAGQQSADDATKKQVVLAAMNVSMTRINGVYEKDLAITMEIVPNNTNVIFISGNDNLSNDGNMINQIQSIMNAGIGVNNYDIGHVVGTGDGGVASLGSVCSSAKAQGVTGNPNPVGDPFTIDYVAHEMGHQFGAEHTFNGNTGSCGGGNRNAATAVEPGSGTTIMAYAGICGTAINVQQNSNDYFHAVSIAQIAAFVASSGGTCAVQVPMSNTPPAIGAISGYTIPKSTAFILKGNATDAQGDALTYCWEQINALGTASGAAPTATITSGPSYRSLSPTTSPDRYMPALSSVLANNLTPTWEVTPAVARILNFALTVRDNHSPMGGQTARANVGISVNGTAGPFTVTSQNTGGLVYAPGSTQTITWNVAGTDANNINTSSVNILLSTDGGLTFGTTIVANTANDGTQQVTMPNVASDNCRIKIEPVGNIYYAVNSQKFTVGVYTETCTTYTNNTALVLPDNSSIQTSLIAVPATGGTLTDVNVTATFAHPRSKDILMAIVHPDGTQRLLWNAECNNESSNFTTTFDDAGAALNCAALNNGTYKPEETLSSLNGRTVGGQWSLIAGDFTAGQSGQISSWALRVCYQALAPAGVKDFGLDGFTLYPNPNNGSFTVGFTSASTNDINVAVHDMRGRQVMAKSFKNTGLFSGNINLNNVEGGVYLVTVQDGDRSVVKRIVVQ